MVNQLCQKKLATVTKTLVSNMRVLVCPCVVQKVTAHVYGKTLNISHQSQKGFRGILFGITQQQKGYLTYVPSTQKIVSSHEIVFDEFISSA